MTGPITLIVQDY